MATQNRIMVHVAALFVIILLRFSFINGENTVKVAEDSSATSPKDTDITGKRKASRTSANDWGSFYDPNNIFCGKYDCYKILGFDYLTWGTDPPTLKNITQSYRSLSRQWHPDKNKGKDAREKFMAIHKAYDILTNLEKRKEYDHFRDRPDEYFKKYGSSVLWKYAPKTDATFILFLFLALGSAFTYYAQKSSWQRIANHLVKAAVEDLNPREGGSTESIEIREKAMKILAEMKKSELEKEKPSSAENLGNGKNNDKKKKDKAKLTAKEKREKDQEELRPIIVQIVNEIDDFGAGFRKPTMHDLLVVRMVKWPYHFTMSVLWWSKYALNRLKNLELSDEEIEKLTINAVGEVAWVAASEEERKKMLTLELWVTENLVEWKEEVKMNQLGLSESKKRQIRKMKNKTGGTEDNDKYD